MTDPRSGETQDQAPHYEAPRHGAPYNEDDGADIDQSHGAYAYPGLDTEAPRHEVGEKPVPAASTALSRAERRAERARKLKAAKRRRRIFTGLVAAFVVIVAVLGYSVRDKIPGFDSAPEDYSSGAAGPEVIVHIEGAVNSDFARALVAADVVKSAGAFNEAASNSQFSAGYYLLPTKISADEAVAAMSQADNAHRVGLMSVNAGVQLDTTRSADGRVTPGVLQLISDATKYVIAGQEYVVTEQQLRDAAATATPEELGIPAWARAAVDALPGDHRRIEGLIAPGQTTDINPEGTPVQILHDLIVHSAAQFEANGLLAAGAESGMDPYQTLVAASIVEMEVNRPEYYAKVARVIANRLAVEQQLQMDSTINFTRIERDVNVFDTQQETPWNTYVIPGLPATPIGAVGLDALTATEHPEPGEWLYFFTVDAAGTTMFSVTFEEHEGYRQQACDSGFLTC